MLEARHHFREALKELERQMLESFDLVIEQLDRALESIGDRDVELASTVIAADEEIDRRYLEMHHGLVSVLALQAPVAGDLRIAAALLHVIRCVERMGDQCVNIAKLVQLSGQEAPTDQELLDTIERMGQLARSQAFKAKESFAARNVALAENLAQMNGEINQMNRAIINRAIDIGDDLELREWAMFMILVARCLERIAGNTVDIAEQVLFIVTGLFREFTGEPQSA